MKIVFRFEKSLLYSPPQEKVLPFSCITESVLILCSLNIFQYSSVKSSPTIPIKEVLAYLEAAIPKYVEDPPNIFFFFH